MKRNCLILLIVSLLVLCSCAQPPSDVNILTHSGVKYDPGTVRISGEVQNTGTSNLEYVRLCATLYDSENNVLGTEYTNARIDVLPPGDKAPFCFIIIWGGVERYKSYSLKVTEVRQTTKQPYRDFEWLDQSSFIDKDGWYQVRGSIKNTGTQDVRLLTFLVTFYDAEGTVLWLGTDQLKEGLVAGETASFEAQAISHISPEIESYSLKTVALL